MNYSNLNGKVAIVTGGAEGIGAATAKKLARSGVVLSLIDVKADALKNTANECEALSAKFNTPKPFIYVGDLTDDATRSKFVDDTLKQFGRLDILVNNAGICSPSSVFDSTMGPADKLFSILLRAPYDMCRLTSKHLVETKGSIINIASVCGSSIFIINPAYAIAKAAMIHLTRCFADELGPFNVRVNSISPGPIKTDIIKPYSPAWNSSDKHPIQDFGEKLCAMQRSGEPEEIANVVAFLSSNESSYMTGSDVVVDGGNLCKHRADIYQ